MQESNSFKDALKRVLVPEEKVAPVPTVKRKKAKKSYVAEAIGTLSPTSTTQNGAAQGLPPFSRASADHKHSGIDMRDIGKEEDKISKDHGKAPYPLETVLDFIAHSGEDLQNAQNLVDSALRKNNVSLTTEQQKVLRHALQAIKSSLGNIDKAASWITSI
jgi:hypothetical protein